VAAGCSAYGPEPPYSPDALYPEYPFDAATIAGVPNPAYEAVRSALRLLGLDAQHLDTPEWNPLDGIVRPGDTVVLKPNFVRDFRETHDGDGNCTITHGSILRAVADYVHIALAGRGRIIIADAPQNDADFARIRRLAGLDELEAFYARCGAVPLNVYDLRPERADKIDGVIVGHRPLPGDPAGYVRVNLGERSAFHTLGPLCDRLYGAEYDTAELRQHHRGDLHEYLISRTVLAADCVISVPKLKTHKKVGITVNLKNLVGINGNKNWLPHHREGTPAQGGDQFHRNGLKQRLEQRTVAGFKQVFSRLGPVRALLAGPCKALGKSVFGDTNVATVRSGNWYGNDTAWRMVLDLNRILLYADAEGTLHTEPQRRWFSVVDGITAGEGNGPLDATAKDAGVVVAGFNPVAVDLACARLMGFDYGRIPMLREALAAHGLPLVDFPAEGVCIRSNESRWNRRAIEIAGPALAFRSHFGWQGQVEVAARDDEVGTVS